MQNDIKIHGYVDEAKGQVPLVAPTGYALEETTIEMGGVIRCCLGTVANEYAGQRVMLGAKSKCLHCGTTFTLVEIKPGMQTCYKQPVKWPVWKPDWQLKDGSQGFGRGKSNAITIRRRARRRGREMNSQQIKERCITKLKMTPKQAQIVVDNLDTFASPDFSEMSWRQIDTMFRDVLYCATHPNPILCAS